jgi:hypothetical protein
MVPKKPAKNGPKKPAKNGREKLADNRRSIRGTFRTACSRVIKREIVPWLGALDKFRSAYESDVGISSPALET